MAKNTTRNVLIIIGIVVVVILIIFFLLFQEGLIFGQPESCDVTPNDYKCTCSFEEVKGRIGGGFSCFEESLPSSWTLPVQTIGEAVLFAKDQIGSGVRCDGDMVANWAGIDLSMSALSSTPVECIKMLSSDTGRTVWRVDFNAEDGFIWTRRCNPTYIENCPENFEFVPEEPEPQDEIGFFCNEDEFNDYVSTLQGLSKQEIISKITNSCENTKGTPVFPYTTDTSIGMSGVTFGGWERMVCRVPTSGGGVLSAWGFIWNSDGSITIDGNRDVFGFTEVGLCFRI